jgi:hypothetical protein
VVQYWSNVIEEYILGQESWKVVYLKEEDDEEEKWCFILECFHFQIFEIIIHFILFHLLNFISKYSKLLYILYCFIYWISIDGFLEETSSKGHVIVHLILSMAGLIHSSGFLLLSSRCYLYVHQCETQISQNS